MSTSSPSLSPPSANSSPSRSSEAADLELVVRRACADLGRRLRGGDECRAEDFFASHPEIVANTDAALEVIYTEFVVRRELQQAVALADWFDRFPEWRQDLRQLLEVHEQVCEDERRKATHASGRSTLDFSARRSAAPIGEPGADEGRLVGNYQLVEEIGRGGMGVVYRARQLTLNRDVALKMVLSGEYASPRELARFQKEAEAAAGLQHPNIVQIFEVGAHDGRAFLSMELVDGANLEKRLAHSPLSARDAALLMETLARVVNFAHEWGVVHRDLKPSNVLLTSQDVPKVADFGLAKHLSDSRHAVTRSGAIIGTPSYMAPEQALGDSIKVGPETDVYSLGAILYEMLAGRPPLVGSTPLETLRRVVHDDPLPPSRVRWSVPRDLETICLKCLEKSPERRYRTAAALADDLTRFLRGEPIAAKAVGVVERVVKWARRRPAAALLIVSLALCLAVVSAMWRRAEGHREAAQLLAINAEQSRATAKSEQLKAERSLYFRRVGQAIGEWQSHQVGRADRLLEECPPEWRQWEWRYAKALCNAELRTMRGHNDAVWCVAYSPDGKLIASGSGHWGWGRPGEVILWDAITGERVATLVGHNGPIMGLAFSPDSGKLASASVGWEGKGPGGVKIWSTSGEELCSLPRPIDNSHSVAFSPDGRWLTVADYGGDVVIWDMERSRIVRRYRWKTPIKNSVFEVAFSPDGKWIAAGGRDGQAQIWDVVTGRTIKEFLGYGDIRNLKFSPDGRQLAFSQFNNVVYIADVSPNKIAAEVVVEKAAAEQSAVERAAADKSASGRRGVDRDEPKKFTFDIGVIAVFAFSPDGRRIVMCSADGNVLIANAQNGVQLRRYDTHDGSVRGVAFSPDGRRIVTCGIDGLVKLWDAKTDLSESQVSFPMNGYFQRLAVTPDGKRVLLACGFNRGWQGVGEMSVIVFDFEEWRVVQRLRGHRGWLSSVAVSADGKLYATASEDRTARVWDAATGECLRVLDGHGGKVTDVGFSPDCKCVATTCADGGARIWDVASGELRAKLSGHDKGANRLAFDSKGDRLATAGDDRMVRIWCLGNGEQIRVLHGHEGAVTSVKFSGDDRWIATSSDDETVRSWRSDTGQQQHVMRGHRGQVTDVVFSPDSLRLASSGADGTVKLWDFDCGEEALTIRGMSAVSPVTAVQFSRGGKQLLAVREWSLLIWDSEQRQSPPAAFAAFDAANRKWHEAEWRKCEENRQFFAATYHLDRLLLARPDNGQWAYQRGDLRGDLGDFKGAMADYDLACEKGSPATALNAHQMRLLILLKNGDRAEFLRTCQQCLDMAESRNGVVDLNNAVWHASIASHPEIDRARALAMIDRAMMAATPEEQRLCAGTRAAALFRCGRLEEAIAEIRHSQRINAKQPVVDDYYFLALIESAFGRPEQARTELEFARRLAASRKGEDGNAPAARWWEVAVWEQLDQEAARSLEPAR